MWLGIGDALAEAIEGGQLELLRDMYDNWPFFKVGSSQCCWVWIEMVRSYSGGSCCATCATTGPSLRWEVHSAAAKFTILQRTTFV